MRKVKRAIAVSESMLDAAAERAQRRLTCPSCKKHPAIGFMVFMGTRVGEWCRFCDYAKEYRPRLVVVQSAEKKSA
jgi:hypothetical protein